MLKLHRKKILFISHDASRTGAPILLLNLLKWLKNNTDLDFDILFRESKGKKAELISAFKPLGKVYKLDNTIINYVIKAGNKLKYPLLKKIAKHIYAKKLKRIVNNDIYDLVYSNTVVNGDILDIIDYKCPVLTHIHELEYVIRNYAGIENLKKTVEKTDRFIAVSKAVKKNLVENHNISAKIINTVYEFVPSFENFIKNKSEISNIRKELNIQKNAKIIGCAGTIEWRKGPDIFIELAGVLKNRSDKFNTHFLWVGGDLDSERYSALSYDIRKLGLDKNVHFIGAKTDPIKYFSIFDVFVLTSREDPFPLVMLEVAAIGKPIVCFDNSGGAGEFVENDCGYIVPYLDILSMSDRILELLNNSDLIKKFGSNAKRKVETKHNIDTAAGQILKLINRTITNNINDK